MSEEADWKEGCGGVALAFKPMTQVADKVRKVDKKVEDLDERVQGVNIRVEAVDDKVRTMGSKVQGVDHKLGSVIKVRYTSTGRH